MDAADVADQIRELKQGQAEQRSTERFNGQAALVIAVLAMLLAIASLGGDNASEDMMHANIKANDMWAFYQAKNIRQTANKLAAGDLKVQLQLHGHTLTPKARRKIQTQIEQYQATVERYESEPDPKDPNNALKGEGKKQLKAQAEDWERQREEAAKQDTSFDYSTTLFQVGIVLGSVAILATSRPILMLALVLGGVSTLLMLNGFLLFF